MNMKDMPSLNDRRLDRDQGEDILVDRSYWALVEYARLTNTPVPLPETIRASLLFLLETELARIDAVRPIPHQPV
jgi:hypothetical protein